MEKSFSLYLDLLRFTAAVLVVVAHLIIDGMVGGQARSYLPDLGRQSVIIFFVLSGYVIAYTTKNKSQTLTDYAIARSARIYSVAAPILVLSVILYAVFNYLGKVEITYQLKRIYFYFPFYLTFMGDMWRVSEVPTWLHSYWSLDFEVWYYVFFASVFFFKGSKRWVIAGIVFILMGYKLWLLLPIWLSGVFLYKNMGRFEIGRGSARMGWAASIAALILFKVFGLDHVLGSLGSRIWPFPTFPLGSAEKFLSDYVVCIFVLANFYFAKYSKFTSLEKYSRPIRFLASYTFTLYLLHPLVNSIWKINGPKNIGGALNVSLLLLVTFALTFIVGELSEKRKDRFTAFFGMIFPIMGNMVSRSKILVTLLSPNAPAVQTAVVQAPEQRLAG